MFAFGLFTQSGASPRTNEFPQGKPPFFSSSEEGYWNALDAAFILIMVSGDLRGLLACMYYVTRQRREPHRKVLEAASPLVIG